MNIIQIINKFSTQEACIEYLEKKRWDNEPHCPYCDNKLAGQDKNLLLAAISSLHTQNSCCLIA